MTRVSFILERTLYNEPAMPHTEISRQAYCDTQPVVPATLNNADTRIALGQLITV